MFFSAHHAVTQTVVARWLKQKRFAKRLQLVLTVLLDAQNVLNEKKEQPKRPAGRKSARGYWKTNDNFIDFWLPEKKHF